jgi:hypothetical protein
MLKEVFKILLKHYYYSWTWTQQSFAPKKLENNDNDNNNFVMYSSSGLYYLDSDAAAMRLIGAKI